MFEEVFYPQQQPPDEFDEGMYLTLDGANDERCLQKLYKPLLFRPDDVLATFTASQDFDPVKRLVHRTKLRPKKPPHFPHSSFAEQCKERYHKRLLRKRDVGYLVRREKGLTQCNIPPDDGHIFTYFKRPRRERTEALHKHMTSMLKKDDRRSPAVDAQDAKYNYNAYLHNKFLNINSKEAEINTVFELPEYTHDPSGIDLKLVQSKNQ